MSKSEYKLVSKECWHITLLLVLLLVASTIVSCGEKENQEEKRQAFVEKARKLLYERVDQYHNYGKADKPEQMAKMILPKANIQAGTRKAENSADLFLALYRSPLVNTLLSHKIEKITFNENSTEAIVRIQLLTRNRDGQQVAGSEKQKWVFVYDTWYYHLTDGMDGWK